MSVTIWDNEFRLRSTGRNLAIMFRYAKGRGVKSITISKAAHVTVRYVDGWTAETTFADYEHAKEWARHRSEDLGRAGWFTGCEVILKN